MATLSAQIIGDTPAIKTAILNAMKPALTKIMQKIATEASEEIRKQVIRVIKNTSVFQDLLSRGQLYGELGEKNPGLDAILDVWGKILYLKVIPVSISGDALSTGFKMGMVREDWQDVLKLSVASYINISKNRSDPEASGRLIEWLKWLLIEGDKLVSKTSLYDYYVEVVTGGRGSRTGQAIMKRVTGQNGRTGYRIPANYSGTADNNFVTRAVNLSEPTSYDLFLSVTGIITNVLKKYSSGGVFVVN